MSCYVVPSWLSCPSFISWQSCHGCRSLTVLSWRFSHVISVLSLLSFPGYPAILIVWSWLPSRHWLVMYCHSCMYICCGFPARLCCHGFLVTTTVFLWLFHVPSSLSYLDCLVVTILLW
jgi:hypothetical protein